MTVLPHVDAGFNLARWLLRNDQDAEDAVQTASIRAFQNIDSFRGTDSKAWFLSIVRNSSLNIIRKRHPLTSWDDAVENEIPDTVNPSPEQAAMRVFDAETVRRVIDTLPPSFKEVIVLRELEGLSYKEIAVVVGCPIGTVMSRLAKARRRMQSTFGETALEEAS